jgi:hypothetical protein
LPLGYVALLLYCKGRYFRMQAKNRASEDNQI